MPDYKPIRNWRLIEKRRLKGEGITSENVLGDGEESWIAGNCEHGRMFERVPHSRATSRQGIVCEAFIQPLEIGAPNYVGYNCKTSPLNLISLHR
ncbi:MAG: hypothetical protein WA192_10050 [Candidatus Acidiferrales bacterium]